MIFFSRAEAYAYVQHPMGDHLCKYCETIEAGLELLCEKCVFREVGIQQGAV